MIFILFYLPALSLSFFHFSISFSTLSKLTTTITINAITGSGSRFSPERTSTQSRAAPTITSNALLIKRILFDKPGYLKQIANRSFFG